MLLSLAHEVNRISRGSTPPKNPATCLRAWARAPAVRRAGSYIELGLKYSSVKKGIIASQTSGAIRVVALLST